jgi:spermidine synthase
MNTAEIRQRNLMMLALFVVSGAGLAFEITLTRIFSLFFQYHYVFLAVSLAVLGLSLGAAWGHFRPHATLRTFVLVLIALGAVFPAAAIILSRYPSAGSVAPRAVVALVPFILIGLFAALTFERFSAFSGLFYGADLMGAGVGVLAVLGMLSLWSAFGVVLALGVLISGAALALAVGHARTDRRLTSAAALVCAIGIALFAANLATGVINFHPAWLSSVPRDKTMLQVLDDPAQQARIVYTAWSPFSQVDVVETNDPSSRYVFSDGGAGSYMLRYDGTLDSLQSWKQTVDYLPFSVSKTDKTLVIGAGGGKDVALALLAGAQQITAVEVNPAVVEATRHFADYNGDILDLPQVDLVVGDARGFVERNDTRYDLIYLNLVYTQAAESGSQALIENYIFTWEAFKTYLERLNPGGQIAVVSHNALEASRAAITALRAFDEMGVPPAQALDHLLLWMVPASDPTVRTSVLLVSKDALSQDTIDQFGRSARQLGMQGLFVPGDFEVAFQPLRDGMSLDQFVTEDNTYDLSPTSDDSPYFFQLDHALPRPIQSALVTALLLTVGLTVFAVLMPDTRMEGGLLAWGGMIFYAALIGVGFMLVEIPLIQRFQLLLGYPILSLVAVLATLLFAGGVGSVLSQRWKTGQLSQRVMLAGLWIAGLAVIYRVALPALLDAVLKQPLAVRVLAVIVLTALLGIPMGIPFPSLMRLAGQFRQRVALLWAVNGVFSVLGSVLAVVMSMTWGFSWALLLGALLYVMLAGLSRVMEFG